MNLDVIFSMNRPNGVGGGGSKSEADSIMWANIQALCITKRWRMACHTSAGTIKHDRFLNLSINPRWARPVSPETSQAEVAWKASSSFQNQKLTFHGSVTFRNYLHTVPRHYQHKTRYWGPGGDHGFSSFSAKKAARDNNFQTWKGSKLAGRTCLKPKPHNFCLFKSPGHLQACIVLGRKCWLFPIS